MHCMQVNKKAFYILNKLVDSAKAAHQECVWALKETLESYKTIPIDNDSPKNIQKVMLK